MTKSDIVLKIAAEMGIKQIDAKQIVQMTLDGITDCLVSEGRLELRRFGIFEVRQRKPRKARNPRTGAPCMVPERKTVCFKAGVILKGRVAAVGVGAE